MTTDLDLHCLQSQGISGFSRTRVNLYTQVSQMGPLHASQQGCPPKPLEQSDPEHTRKDQINPERLAFGKSFQ